MREAHVAGTNEIRLQCRSELASPPGFQSRAGRLRAFALPGFAAVADRLRQVPRRGSTSDPARLLDNGSTPGSRRRPEPLLPGAGETPQPDRNRARRPACARRVGGALLPALAAIIAVSLSVQGHAQTSVPHDWGLKPGGLGTGDEFRLLFVSSTSRNGASSTIGDYDTHVQTAAANGHADAESKATARYSRRWAARVRPTPGTTPGRGIPQPTRAWSSVGWAATRSPTTTRISTTAVGTAVHPEARPGRAFPPPLLMA